jgi:hypothetical protein
MHPPPSAACGDDTAANVMRYPQLGAWLHDMEVGMQHSVAEWAARALRLQHAMWSNIHCNAITQTRPRLQRRGMVTPLRVGPCHVSLDSCSGVEELTLHSTALGPDLSFCCSHFESLTRAECLGARTRRGGMFTTTPMQSRPYIGSGWHCVGQSRLAHATRAHSRWLTPRE